MAVDEGATVLLPGQGKTVSFPGTFSGNGLTLVYGGADSAYSLVEWDAAPGARVRRCTYTGRPTKHSTSWMELSASR